MRRRVQHTGLSTAHARLGLTTNTAAATAKEARPEASPEPRKRSLLLRPSVSASVWTRRTRTAAVSAATSARKHRERRGRRTKAAKEAQVGPCARRRGEARCRGRRERVGTGVHVERGEERRVRQARRRRSLGEEDVEQVVLVDSPDALAARVRSWSAERPPELKKGHAP